MGSTGAPRRPYLLVRFDLGLHDERVLAELAVPHVGALDPALQAGLMHVLERAGTGAWRH